MRLSALVLAALLCVVRGEGDDVRCAACGNLMRLLTVKLNQTKEDLAPRLDSEKKKNSIDKVQKAQTKRWLKKEYAVALGAAVEEELELVCTREELTSSQSLRGACISLVEEHIEELPRAVLDDKQDEFCARVVPSCDAAALASSVEAFKPKAPLSEKKPSAAEARVGREKAVKRLVGSTVGKEINQRDRHLLLMLFRSAPGSSTPSYKYAGALEAFYAVAAAANRSKKAELPLTAAQLDLRLNELPIDLPLVDADGLQLVLWLRKEKSTPKLLPASADDLLASLSAEEVRPRLIQMLLTYIDDKHGSALRRQLQAYDKEAAAAPDLPVAEGEGSQSPNPAPAASKPGEMSAAQKVLAEAARLAEFNKRPKRKKTDASPDRKIKRKQECETCGLVSLELLKAIEAAKEEMRLSHDAAVKKQEYIDGVQKAQTKRWLKQEYGANILAAVEDKMDKLCTSEPLQTAACFDPKHTAFPEVDGQTAVSMLRTPDERSFDKATCRLRVQERCASLIEEHSEALLRGMLDGAEMEVCTSVIKKCDQATATLFSSARPIPRDTAPASGAEGAAPEEAKEATAEEAAEGGAKEQALAEEGAADKTEL